jgi:hypothetical protein
VWAGVDSAWEQKKLEASVLDKLDNKKMFDAKHAAREAPQRPVHAVLGAVVLNRNAQLGAKIL